MNRYYFIRSNGHMYRLSRSGYFTWVSHSAARIANNKRIAKLSHYGVDMGEMIDLKNVNDYSPEDIVRLNTLYTTPDAQ